MALSAKLVEVLVCPTCRTFLRYEESRGDLVCESCRVKYQIIEDIPVLLADEAKELN